MSNPTVVEVKSLSKTYKLYDSKYDFIKEAFHPLRKKYHKKFHALKKISFSLEKGEVLGIVGKNGSGKSTLLKILASVVTPTSGEYYCNGKVAALLELSGGFNKDLTGIENIRFLGALQGFSKGDMEERLHQILDFAEIGEYANQPVRSYSSGMYMRLAFSLSIHVDPDILIIDEILAVGDIKFKQKCFRKIREFKEQNKTIIICSHSLSTIRDFCSKAMWIHEGEIKEVNSPKKVVNKYNAFMTSAQNFNQINRSSQLKTDNLSSLQTKFNISDENFKDISWHNMIKCDSYGTLPNFIQYASIIDLSSNKNVNKVRGKEKIRILLVLSDLERTETPTIKLTLNGQTGSPIFTISGDMYKERILLEEKKTNIVAIDFIFPSISNGRYTFSFGVLSIKDGNKKYLHWVHDAILIEVFNPDIKYKTDAQLVIDNVTMKLLKPQILKNDEGGEIA